MRPLDRPPGERVGVEGGLCGLAGRRPVSSSYLSFGKDDEMEEERRLFYVAVTRAKDELYLTYPIVYSGYDGEVLMKISRYLEELPDAVFDRWEVEEETAADVIDLSGYHEVKIDNKHDDFEAIDISELFK